MISGRSKGDQTKPVVNIVMVQPVSENVINSICWGLEEENIPAKVKNVSNDSAELLAKNEANNSKLNIGICINGVSKIISLHHRDLAPDRPLFTLKADEVNQETLRCLGINAARLVKGEPLVFYNKEKWDKHESK